jgi:Lon protease-like protein
MSQDIALFPLGMVLLPGVRVPLHIFEDRYKLMISECLEKNAEFGMMWGTDDDFKIVGCTARVTDVINRFADGRMNVVVEGIERIHLIEQKEANPYISGLVERIPDETDSPDRKLVNETRALYVEALKLSIGWYRAPSEDHEDIGKLSYTIASSLNLPADSQQTLLEELSVESRFRFLRDILSQTLGGLREHARRIGGNGKAH